MSQPITVTGATGIIATIPALLGFHPTNSLVCVCTTGVPRRVGPVARVDYPTGDQLTPTLTYLAQVAAGYGDAAILALYTPDADTLYDEEITPLYTEAGVDLLDIIRITDPTPQQLDDTVEAATILTGRRVLTTRTDLATSIGHHPRRNPADAQELLTQVGTIAARDAFVQAHINNPDMLPKLIDAAQAAPDSDPRTADLCAVLALLAYRNGDGALAQVAIDRARRIHPRHRLAELTLSLISICIHPTELADLFTNPT